MSDLYSFSKSLHLIGMVSWFAGMFYLVRIFVNHAEANELPEPERSILHSRFLAMEWKVFRVIMTPAWIFTLAFGSIMLFIQPVWLTQTWLLVKLVLFTLLVEYHFYCRRQIRKLENGTSTFTHVHFRALNEVPTLFLIAIVFLAVFKDRINFWFLAGGIGLMSLLIATAIRKVARK